MDLYTRNYRIQHSAGHSEIPRDEEQISLECEKTLDEKVAERAVVSEVVTELSQKAVEEEREAEELNEETALPPRKKRAVKHYRVRSSSNPQDSGEKTETVAAEIPAATFEKTEKVVAEADKAPCTEPAVQNHFCARHERGVEKKPFGNSQSPFGIKNFTPEDIFLAAILLLLLNEGCEDIMTLILGFLLLS